MTNIENTRVLELNRQEDGWHWSGNLVTDAELILLHPDQDVNNTLTSHGRLATAFKEFSIETGKNTLDIGLWWKRSETKLLGVPNLISRTEKIEIGDWYYWEGKIIQDHGVPTTTGNMRSKDFHTGAFKILALPEQFAHNQLIMIAKGKLKNEGKCMVECEKVHYPAQGHGTTAIDYYKITLNPYINIYPVEEKPLADQYLEKIKEVCEIVNGNLLEMPAALQAIQALVNEYKQNIK